MAVNYMAVRFMKTHKDLVAEARKRLQDPQHLAQINGLAQMLGIPHSDQLPPGHDDPAAETVKHTSTETHETIETEQGSEA